MSLLESVGKPTFSLAVDKIFCQCLNSVWIAAYPIAPV